MDIAGTFYILIALIVGFGAGYAMRAYISRLHHRRAQRR